MRLALAFVCVAGPALCQTKAEITEAYAFVVGTSEYCGVALDMAEAADLFAASGLDQAEVGAATWDVQKLVHGLEGQALADWCAVVAASAGELGLLAE
jgi:hypothetical protein